MLCIICYARLVSLSFQEIDGQWLRPGSEDIALTRLFTVSVEFYFPENIIPRGSIYAHINKHSPTEHFEIYPRVKKNASANVSTFNSSEYCLVRLQFMQSFMDLSVKI